MYIFQTKKYLTTKFNRTVYVIIFLASYLLHWNRFHHGQWLLVVVWYLGAWDRLTYPHFVCTLLLLLLLLLLMSSIYWHLICCPVLPLGCCCCCLCCYCYCCCLYTFAAADDDVVADGADDDYDVDNSLTSDAVGNTDKTNCASTMLHGNHCMNRTHYVSSTEKNLDEDNNSSSDMEDTVRLLHSTRTTNCCNSDTYHQKGMHSYSSPQFNCERHQPKKKKPYV